MSRQTARLVLDQFNLRPSLVASRYAGGITIPEVTSVGLLGDVRELANASVETEQARATLRRGEIAAAYGYDDQMPGKPFIFADGKAIIPVHGMLLNRFPYSWSFATGYNFIRQQIEAAMNDPDVNGIVYDVNSYGGTVAGCSETSDLIFEASARNGGKPSLAVVDANCYSAAYYTMSAADRLVVTPTGGAGSIGVVLMHMDVSAALDKFGIKVTFIHAGDHKVDANMYQPLSPEVASDLKAEIDKMYDKFVAAVVRNRPGLSDEAVRETQARCYQADDALALGLIDAVQTPPDALESFFNAEDAEDVDPDVDPQLATQDDEPMATQQTPAAAAPAATGPTAEQAAADAASAAATARAAERERVKAITTHPEAEGRAALASHLAMETDLSPEAAAGILKAAPKATATPAAAAAATEDNHFQRAMNAGGHPNVGDGTGAGASADEKPTRAQQILRAQAQVTGRKLENKPAA